MPRGAIVRAAALAAVLATVAAGCGSRAGESEQSGGLGGPDPSTATTAPGDGPADATFGGRPAPCGPGDGTEQDGDDLGLEGDTIKIGVISDRQNVAVPGINEETWFGTLAWATWCNSLGGLDGREIELIEYDANIFSHRDATLAACDEVFALVGSMGIQDNLGAQEMVDCGLIDVAASTVNAKKTESVRVYEPLPNPADTYPAGAGVHFLEEFPEIADKAVYVVTDVPIGHYQRSKHVQAYEQVGYRFLPNVNSRLNEDAWSPIVLELQRSGVEYLSLTSSIEEGRNMLKAMADQGWLPTVVDLEANFYNERLLEMAGSDADGIYVRIAVWPFEEADRNPATAQFIDLMADVGSEPALLAVHGFSAGLLFSTAVQAVDASGEPLTREAVLAELADIHEWDGLGLHSTSDPGTPVPSSCFIIMKIVDGAYTRWYPSSPDEGDGGYACDPEARVDIDTSKLVNFEPGATEG